MPRVSPFGLYPRVVTPDQEWLAEIHKELHRLVLAVERIEGQLRKATADRSDDQEATESKE